VTARTDRYLSRALFAFTLFFSAALLFLIEPMIARMLLPSLGGGPAVWNTCLVFFQAALLGGYLYARVTTRVLPARGQVAIHAGVLAMAALVLPISIRTFGILPSSAQPVLWMLATLGLSVGLPFLALAATNPLLQSWFGQTWPGGKKTGPYRLYSASNLGSFVGLVSYPFVVERAFDLEAQRRLWAIGYGLVALMVVACGGFAWRSAQARFPAAAPGRGAAVTGTDRLRWAALAFVPASLTLSVTAYISADIAAIPLVWVVPLSLYLISFVIAFAHPHVGRAMRLLLPIAVLPPIICVLTDSTRPAWLQIPTHLVTFFLVSLACHQALASRRPETDHLPEFYVWLAAGGAAAGLFNAFAAPILFRTPVEYPIGLLLGCYAGTRGTVARPFVWADAAVPALAGALVPAGSALTLLFGWAPSALATRGLTFGPALLIAAFSWAWPLRYVVALAAILSTGALASRVTGLTLDVERSFFGVHRVMLDDTRAFHEIVDGSTIHGVQAIDPARRRDCLAYYSRIGPAGQTFAMLAATREPHEVAVLGLGAGVMGCYAMAGQRWTFFEIDPVVIALATKREYFTYLADAPGAVQIVVGDARLALGRLPSSSQPYDVIVLDTFSSDAIPVHLLTREALQTYLRHLAKGGLILFHVSNLYFELGPVIGRLARDAGLVALIQRHAATEGEMQLGIFPSEWVAVSRNLDDLGALTADRRWERATWDGGPPWSDQFSNVLAALQWRR
jgi:hypothetical protein